MEQSVKLIKNKVFATNNKQNEIFISRKRKCKNIEKFYYDRAYDLLYNLGFNEVFICGLGACLNHAARIALVIESSLINVKIEKIETESVHQIDDYMNDNIIIERKSDRRSNLIKIKLVKNK